MPALGDQLANQGGRLFGLMKNGVGDYGGRGTPSVYSWHGERSCDIPKTQWWADLQRPPS